MPTAQIQNPAGAFGSTTNSILGQQYTVEVVCATTVTAGQTVALSTTNGQVVAATPGAGVTYCGVAIDDGAAGTAVQVAVLGPTFSVAKDTAAAMTQFDRVVLATTTTGAVASAAGTVAVTQTKDTGNIIGICMAGAITTASTVDVFLVRW